jgi:hypothetical protein
MELSAEELLISDERGLKRYNHLDMKQLQLVALVGIVALLLGCETTQSTGMGNQEQKRLAQIQRQQQENAQYDESDINLWNAHQDVLVRGTNPMIPFTPLARE